MHWAEVKQIGPYWGMRFVLLMQRLLGNRLCLWLIYPAIVFYFVANSYARRSSLQYLQRFAACYPEQGLKPGYWLSFRHFVSFVDSMLDKLASWNGTIAIDEVIMHGREEFLASVNSGKGAVIIGSHLGNIEVSRALASLNNRARLNVLMHTKHAQTFNRLIRDVSNSQQVVLIEVSEISPAIAILLQQKVDQGEFVCIVGDRIPVSSNGRTISWPFLGRPAHFAQGPFILASLLKCPVYTLFCLKTHGRYDFYYEHFADRLKLARKNREESLQQYVGRFAARLEHYCRQAPLQWFNFYDYWQHVPAPERTEKHHE
ncbi:MAG TPA: glycosyl transferase [Pseudomonadales bacterium]